MGLDAHGFEFVRYVAHTAPLGNVATLGRQNLYVGAKRLHQVLGVPLDTPYGPYCEALLTERMGATSVTSFDASDYEHATIVHDMNTPLVPTRTYETVLDIGTLEHVFDLATALRNVTALCRVGGRIAHVLPGNNFSGHGFWQFSPELFFSLYSEQNGFADTEVFVAELDDPTHWWRAARPTNGVRVEFTGSSRAYVMALTRKTAAETRQSVQQSDYLVNWDDGAPPSTAATPSLRRTANAALKRLPGAWRLADRLLPITDTHTDAWVHHLAPGHRHYTKIAIETLFPGTAGVLPAQPAS